MSRTLSSPGTGIDRRQFLKLSAGGTATLALLGASSQLTGCSATVIAAPGMQFLTPDDVALFTALLPVVNGAAYPAADAAVRDRALQRIDEACALLQAPARAELRKLIGLLHLRVFRRLVCGVSTGWDQASAGELTAFLQRWRDSRVGLFNAGYRALTKLAAVGWWSQAASWPGSTYPGPPAWALAALNARSA